MPTIAHDTAPTEFERCEHLLQSATFRTHHDADSQIDDSDASIASRLRRFFPFGARLTKEARAGLAVFSHQIRTTVSVVADRRGTNEDLRWILQFGQRVSEQRRAVNAAVANQTLHPLRPATMSDVVPAEMHDRVAAFQCGRIDRSRCWIPGDVPRWLACVVTVMRGLSPDKPHNVVTASRQKRNELRADQAGRTSDCDFHGWRFLCCRVKSKVKFGDAMPVSKGPFERPSD